MKKILCILASLLMVVACSNENSNSDERFSSQEFKSGIMHVFDTKDAHNDVAFIFEGDDSLVVLEPPLFYADTEALNNYIEGIGKPIEKIIANYHQNGIADYPADIILMPIGIYEFSKTDRFKDLQIRMQEHFGEGFDARPFPENVITFQVPSVETIAGIEFEFISVPKDDLQAANILIGDEIYYLHNIPEKRHATIYEARSKEHIKTRLNELEKIKNTNASIILGSHGMPTGIEDVDFQIKYFNTILTILNENTNADEFKTALIASFPNLAGEDSLQDVVNILYKN